MAAKKFLVDADFNTTSTATGLRAPTAASDAATKAYVDSAIEGLAWKDSVRAASTANVTVASPGTTIDGVTMAASDRVLLKNQTTGSENGLYVWNGSATPMTRSFDAQVFNDLEQAVVTVEEGTTNAGTSWRQTVVNGTIGVTTNTWAAFGTAAPAASTVTAGIVRLATTTEANAATDATIAVTPADLGALTLFTRKFAVTIGDNSSTTLVVTHNLNSQDVLVQVYNAGGSLDLVDCVVERTSVNTVSLKFTVAPATNALRAVVVA